MISLGTACTPTATKIMLLGSGELGKEIAICAQSLGIEVIAVDRYAQAPAMQVAHKHYVISMLEGEQLRAIIEKEKPNFIVPEIEAIATDTLIDVEKAGFTVVPNAKAVQLTMNRQGIRSLAHDKLKLNTSPYRIASTIDEYHAALKVIGLPCVVKPLMSSSGKGQTILKDHKEVEHAWEIAQKEARGKGSAVIVEAYIAFDSEITLLTIRHQNGTSFCAPIGHVQIDGDYRESWQPHPMSAKQLNKVQEMAKTITDELGGFGLFGVEFFLKGDEVFFNEVSPRPHDTGLVTLVSQDLSEFALHVRAFLGLPIPAIKQYESAASCALLAEGIGDKISYGHIDEVLMQPGTQLRLFAKPTVQGKRRVGVILAVDKNIELARAKAKNAHDKIKVVIE